jgi:hypothetical protein
VNLFVGELLGANPEFIHLAGDALEEHNVNIYITLTTNNKNLVIKTEENEVERSLTGDNSCFSLTDS